MKVIGKGSVIQRDMSKPRSRCRDWELSVKVEYDDGSKHKKTRAFHGTYTQAQDALEDFKAELREEDGEKLDDAPFPEYADRWIAWLKRSRSLEMRTIDGYESKLKTAKLHLKCLVSEVTGDMVSEMYLSCMDGETISGKEWSAGSVEDMHRVLSALFHQAERDHVRKGVPTKGLRLPKKRVARREIPDDAELDRILAEADYKDKTQRGIALNAGGGLRRSEATGAYWCDLKEGGIRVLTATDADGSDKGTKNDTYRFVPLPEDLYANLDAVRPANGKTLICGGIAPGALTRWWDRNRKRFGLSCRQHDLRHGWATRLARHGVHPSIIQETGGWKTPFVPMKIYTHVSNEMKREAIRQAFGERSKVVELPKRWKRRPRRQLPALGTRRKRCA